MLRGQYQVLRVAWLLWLCERSAARRAASVIRPWGHLNKTGSQCDEVLRVGRVWCWCRAGISEALCKFGFSAKPPFAGAQMMCPPTFNLRAEGRQPWYLDSFTEDYCWSATAPQGEVSLLSLSYNEKLYLSISVWIFELFQVLNYNAQQELEKHIRKLFCLI